MKIINRLKSTDKDLLEIIKGGGLNFIFYGFNLVIVYLLAILITKYYGASAYGRYSIIKSLILVLIIINTLGLNTYAIKLSSNRWHFEKGYFKSDFLKKSYFVLIFTSIIFTSILFFFRNEIALSIFKDEDLIVYLTYFPFILLFSVFLNYNSNVLKGQGKILVFSFVSSFFNNLIFISLIVVVFNFYSSNESFLIISLLISFIVAFLFSFFKIFPLKYSKVVVKYKYKNLLKESFPMMLSSSMIFIIFSVDTLMLGFFDSSENVGIYRIVTQISGLNAVFLIIFSSIVGPKISNLFSENRALEIRNLILNSSKIIFYISLPILILILVFSKSILGFFGQEYSNGYSAIVILSVSQFFFAITGFVDLILNMTGKQSVFGKITVLTAIFNVFLNLVLIPRYSISGAAIATGFSVLLTNILGLIYVYKDFKFLAVYIPFYNKSK